MPPFLPSPLGDEAIARTWRSSKKVSVSDYLTILASLTTMATDTIMAITERTWLSNF